MHIEIKDYMSNVTKKVVKDFNTLSEKDFFYKYQCSKKKYFNRVKIWKDPFMNSPLARIGKFLAKKNR